MVFRSVIAACGLAAAFCLNSPAQSTGSSSGTATTLGQSVQAGQSTPAQSQPGSPSLQLKDLPPDPHTLTAAEKEQQRAQQVLNAAMRLATLQARWGPDMDTPGLSIALTEVRRAKSAEGATQLTYQITGSGFSPDEMLTLVRWPLDGEARPVMGGLNFDAKGVAICAVEAQPQPSTASTPDASSSTAAPAAPAPNAGPAPSEPAPAPSCANTMHLHQPIEIKVTAASGEAIRVAVMGEDRRHGAAASVVPFPIANADKGCKLQVILGMTDASLVLIEGTGFPPNTPLKIDAVTGTNTRTLHPKTNADGRMVFPLLPGSNGQSNGETTVRFAGVNHVPSLANSNAPPSPDPDCAPAVSFHWGKGTYKAE
jgi:hypothetical protein